MLLARADLARPAVAVRMLAGGAAVAAVVSVTSWATLALTGERAPTETSAAVGAVPTDDPLRLLTVTPHSGTPVEILVSTAIAVAVLGGCLLAARRAPGALAPLAATGRLALSAYAGHILLIAAIGLPGLITLLTDQGYGLLLATVLATPLLALGWTSWIGRGPLERLVGRVADAARRSASSEPIREMARC